MFNGLYYAFYIIFGTNLLTQGPVSVAVFRLFFTSQEINIKRSPNTAKLFVHFYGPEDIQWARSTPGGCPEGGTTHQGVPGPPGTPRWVMPTSVASHTPSLPYKSSNIPNTLAETLDRKFCRRKVSISVKTNLDPVPAPYRRGNHHRWPSSSSRRPPR